MKFHVISTVRGYFIVISWKFSTKQEIENTSISKDNKWNTAVLLMYLFSFLLTPFLFYSTPSLLIYDFFSPRARGPKIYNRHFLLEMSIIYLTYFCILDFVLSILTEWYLDRMDHVACNAGNMVRIWYGLLGSGEFFTRTKETHLNCGSFPSFLGECCVKKTNILLVI